MNFYQTRVVEESIRFTPRIALALLIFAGFVVGTRVLVRLLDSFAARRRLQPELMSLAVQTLKISGYVFGLVSAFGTLGVNVSAAVAGLGLTGFGLSLALKDLLSNLVSGVMILVYRPFHVGDLIATGDKKGRVQEINLRYTVLSADIPLPAADTSGCARSEKVLIPNSRILTDVVVVSMPCVDFVPEGNIPTGLVSSRPPIPVSSRQETS